MPPPGKHRNIMCLPRLLLHHPAYEMLLEYSTGGCPVNTGCNWTKEDIHASFMRVPHESNLVYKTIAHFYDESKGKI